MVYIPTHAITGLSGMSALVPAVSGFDWDDYTFKVRYDFTDADSITLVDTDKISQADDLSGNGNHVVQATASQRPVQVTQDGELVAQFSDARTNEHLKVASFAGGNIAQPATMFIVLRATDVDNGSFFNLTDGATSDTLHRWSIVTNNANPYNIGIRAWTAVLYNAMDTNTHALFFQLNTTSSGLYFDGGSSALNDDYGTSDLEGLVLGARYDGATDPPMQLMEFGIASPALTLAEINEIGDYFDGKYPLTWTTAT